MAYSPMVTTESSLLSLKEWLMHAQTMAGSANTRRQRRTRHLTLTLLALSMIRTCSRVGCSSASLQKYPMKWVGVSLDPGRQASIDIQSGVTLLLSSLTLLMGLTLDLQNWDSSMFFCSFSEKWVLKKLVFQRSCSGKAVSRAHPSSFRPSRSPPFSSCWHFLHLRESLGCMAHPRTVSTRGSWLRTASATELNFCSLVMPDSNRTSFWRCSPCLAQLRIQSYKSDHPRDSRESALSPSSPRPAPTEELSFSVSTIMLLIPCSRKESQVKMCPSFTLSAEICRLSVSSCALNHSLSQLRRLRYYSRQRSSFCRLSLEVRKAFLQCSFSVRSRTTSLSSSLLLLRLESFFALVRLKNLSLLGSLPPMVTTGTHSLLSLLFPLLLLLECDFLLLFCEESLGLGGGAGTWSSLRRRQWARGGAGRGGGILRMAIRQQGSDVMGGLFEYLQLMLSKTLGQSRQEEEMQRTGIQSIDSFFNYGEKVAGLPRVPFAPLIANVLDMFQSEYTELLHDRKANAIIKFCEDRPQGFFYEEVEGLTRLFELARADLERGVEEMVPALQRVLEVDCANPNAMFNRNAGSDELRYLRCVPEFLTSLEPFLRYQQWAAPAPHLELLREAVVDYLKRFAERQIPEILSREEAIESTGSAEGSPVAVLMAEGTKQLRVIGESRVLETLVELLYDYRNQGRLLFSLLELMSYMMMYAKLAEELCRKGVLHLVMEVMLQGDDFRSSYIRTGFEIFWSAIEGVGVECLAALNNQAYVSGLQRLLTKVIKEGYKLEDKCLRNEIVILVNYLLSIPEMVPLFLTKADNETGKPDPAFLEILFSYSTVDEAVFYETKTRSADRKVLFGTNAEDLQLKKLLWSGLLNAIESRDENVIGLAKGSHFIRYLLLYIDSANSSYAVTRWSVPQLRELQGQALSVLANVVLHMKDDFEEKKGIFCLTKFLSNANDMERREKCLKAFANASLFEEGYKVKISEEGVIDYLLEFLQGEENPIEIKELCLTIVANLCNGCKKNKKLFREKNGVDILIAYLKDPNIASSNRYVLLGLALLNALWNAVLGSRRSEERFLSAQGLFDLLEFIEACDYVHRKMALSCLSYLTENAKAIKEFLEWNSEKSMVNATQLMIRLYGEEDEKYGVKYEQGVVVNRSKPLVPDLAKKLLPDPAFLKDLTEAGTETYLVNRIREEVEQYDVRLIVFSILYRVGFARNDLNAYEQQKLEVIQMYPHFKMGEIWGDIRRQLQEEGVAPTEDDQHWMETSIEEFEEQMNNCVNTQQLIMREFNKNQEGELHKFYQVIKHNKQIK